MQKPPQVADCRCIQLQQRIALSILFDEIAVGTIASAMAALRRADDPVVPDLDHAIRSHRVAILKQRARLGAVGIDV